MCTHNCSRRTKRTWTRRSLNASRMVQIGPTSSSHDSRPRWLIYATFAYGRGGDKNSVRLANRESTKPTYSSMLTDEDSWIDSSPSLWVSIVVPFRFKTSRIAMACVERGTHPYEPAYGHGNKRCLIHVCSKSFLSDITQRENTPSPQRHGLLAESLASLATC